jgi:uncharacterized protein YndB with AHSA1/START domain
MASVTASTDVSASPEQAWAVLSDPSRYDEWLDLHQGFVGEPPHALEQGTTFGERVKVMGMPADVRWTVQDLEAPHRLRLTGTGPMGVGLEVRYTVEEAAVPAGRDEAGPTCRVVVVMEFSGAALMAVGGQLEREVDTQLRSSIVKFRALAQS